jgi:hypothetical protein
MGQIVSASKTAPWYNENTVIHFTGIDYNVGQSFNGTHLTPKSNGLFLFYISHPMPFGEILNISLVNSNEEVLSDVYASDTSLTCSFSAYHLASVNRTQSVRVVATTPMKNIGEKLSAIFIAFRVDETWLIPYVAWQGVFSSKLLPEMLVELCLIVKDLSTATLIRI